MRWREGRRRKKRLEHLRSPQLAHACRLLPHGDGGHGRSYGDGRDCRSCTRGPGKEEDAVDEMQLETTDEVFGKLVEKKSIVQGGQIREWAMTASSRTGLKTRLYGKSIIILRGLHCR